MKNVHLLPTDKSSRLYKTGGFLLLDSRAMPNNTLETKNQYIYIISDEEIKEGDWVISNYGELIKILYKGSKVKENVNKYCKKIILTTDLELQKDGVQAIDDEFLEWFVKNPSCESVKTLWTIPAYKIEKEYRIEFPQEEPKQETLEDIKLEEVFGSNYCQFSVIENKLAILYRNQEQLLKAIKLLSNETRNT